MSNVDGLRKEYLATASFRLILQDALDHRPEIRPFSPSDQSKSHEQQFEEFKSMSAEQRGFDLAFKYITGKYPGDIT